MQAKLLDPVAPGLFDLSVTPFDLGMRRMQQVPFCQAIDQGDMIRLARIADIEPQQAQRIRDTVGDCGLCRLASVRLAQQPDHDWLKPTHLSEHEIRFYEAQLGRDLTHEIVPMLMQPGERSQQTIALHRTVEI